MEFQAEDQRYALTLTESHIARILAACSVAGDRETGGILMGYYVEAHDRAIVTDVSMAPGDSESGRAWFLRGVLGLQEWIDRLWTARRHYYLGEWHFHPFAAPNPSSQDLGQLEAIARSPLYKCPEPLLLILGGDPNDEWQLRAFVVPRGRNVTELIARG